MEAIARLQGAAIPASILESDVLPARVRGFRPADLDALCASGDLVWIGAGALGADDGRVSLCSGTRLRLLAPTAPRRRTRRPARCTRRSASTSPTRGASFWPDLVQAAGTATRRRCCAALWDLVWAGEVTNDTLAPAPGVDRRHRVAAPAGGPRTRAAPRPGALRRAGPPAGAGRWSLVGRRPRRPRHPPSEPIARALQLLDRHGVVTREAVLAEGTPGGFAGVYPVLKPMEEAGKVRRGYFVAGLGAAQFAHPGRGRSAPRAGREGDAGDRRWSALAAADPAQPYGAALAWPETAGRPSAAARAPSSCWRRRAGGVPGTRRADARRRSAPTRRQWADALAVAGEGRAGAQDRAPADRRNAAGDHPAAAVLREAGFADGYRGLTLRG